MLEEAFTKTSLRIILIKTKNSFLLDFPVRLRLLERSYLTVNFDRYILEI